MKFIPYHELAGRPNIVVDGEGTDGTMLTLSHWPGSGSPSELAADLSTQIAFRYLDTPTAHVAAEAASNNHYDQDGVCGVFAVLEPEQALQRRDMLIDIASAGDFETFRSRDAARISMALAAFGDEERSPIASALAGRSYPDQVGSAMDHVLPRLAEMIDNPAPYKALWEEEDARLAADDAAIASGRVTIEEAPDIDLAILTAPEGYGPGYHDDQWSGGCHPMAIHNRTQRFRVLVVQGSRFIVRYRYETWVNFMSRPVLPRVDLKPLAAMLSNEDSVPWKFDGVGHMTPALHTQGGAESSLGAARFRELVGTFLRAS
ncbi:MAG: DUF6687 family protein [Actinomycetota bacterium]|nr:hypothetical protein [Actinomycetota bacterium]